jgi:tape measure domain-containing protein
LIVADVVQIQIRADGGQEVVRQFDDIGRASVNAGLGFGTFTSGVKDAFNWLTSLRGLIVTVVAGEAISKLAEYSDGYTNLIGKLKLTSNSQTELLRTEQALFDVAQRTRADLASTGNLYTRLAQTAGQYGIAQTDILPIIETFNKTLLLSGANAQEGGAAIRQFSQALGSGKLAGDELRSIGENASVFFTKLNKYVPEANGNLRAFAAQGGLTAKIVARATLAMQEEVDKSFGKLPLTIGQSLTLINNAAMRFFGQLSLEVGTGGGISQGLAAIAANFETIAKSVGVAAASVIGFVAALGTASAVSSLAAVGATALEASGRLALLAKTGSAIGPIMVTAGTATQVFSGATSIATGFVSALWATIRAHPFIALFTILTGIITLVYAFGDSMKIPGTQISLLQALTAAWGIMKIYLQAAWDVAKGLFAEFQASQAYWPVLYGAVVALAVVLGGMFAGALLEAGVLVAKLASGLITLTAATLTNPWFLLTAAILGVALVIAQLTGTLEPMKAALSAAADSVLSKWTPALAGARTELEKTRLEYAGVGTDLKKLEEVQAVVEARTKAQVAAQAKLNQTYKEERDHINAIAGEQQRLTDYINVANGGVKALTSSWKIYSNDRKGDMEREKDDWKDLTDRYIDQYKKAIDLLAEAVRKQRQETEAAEAAARALYPSLYAVSNVSMSGTVGSLGGIVAAASSATQSIRATQSAFESLKQASTMDSLTNITGSFYDLIGPAKNFEPRVLKANAAEAAYKLAELKLQADGTPIPAATKTAYDAAQKDRAAMKYEQAAWAAAQPKGFFDLKYAARGGSWMVGGTNGTDNVSLANLRVSPGERVTVQTPSQQNEESWGSSSPVNVRMTIVAPNPAGFRRSETQIAASMQSRLRRVQARLGK